MLDFDFLGFLLALAPYFWAFMAIVLLDLIAAVIRALMSQEFEWECLPEFLLTAVNYLMAWILAEALGVLMIAFGIEVSGYKEVLADVAPKAVYGFVILKYAASLVGHIKEALK